MIRSLFFMVSFTSSLISTAQSVIPLYPGKIPNSTPTFEEEKKDINQAGWIHYGKVSKPTLEIYLPPKDRANGTAVVIYPGGAYAFVSYTNEGTDIASAFNKIGVAAFIVKYRLPNDRTMEKKSIGPLQDAQQAIKTVRQRSSEWNIDPNKVGIIGFSAGGHLASTTGTHFEQAVIDNKENVSLRPDFMILGYPVISMNDSLTHKGSKANLLGNNPSAEQVQEFSNETRITAKTPPTFLFHSGDDMTVKVQNSIRFYEALISNKVSAEIHIYPGGGHGYGLNNSTTPDKWMDRVENWMKSNGWLKSNNFTP